MSMINPYTIELSPKTYERLASAANQQRLAIETLIETWLDMRGDAPEPAHTDEDEHPFAYLLNIAEDLGVDDLAENHDHYLYGVPKR